jgi:hypothetical protein
MSNEFQTKRTELLEAYRKNGVPFLATTRGLHSVRSLLFQVMNLDTATGTIGFLVAKKGQELIFFNYGLGQPIELAGDPQHVANEADTSLTRGSSTTASADLSIEWITMNARAIKAAYTQAAATPIFPDFVATVDPDPVVTAALQGKVPMVDPFGNVIPADVASSATLEHVLYQAAAPHMSCKFEWDNADRTEKIGTCEQFTEGGGASYLHSNGEPSVANRFRIPEGFLWGREGQPAGQLQVICKLETDIVIPYVPPASKVGAGFPVLRAVYVEMKMRLGGMLLRVPGSN